MYASLAFLLLSLGRLTEDVLADHHVESLGEDVAALVACLDSESWHFREAADSRLLELAVSRDGVRARLERARKHASPEVRRRAARLLGASLRARSEALGRVLDRHVKAYPQIDMLWYDVERRFFNSARSPGVRLVYESAQPFIDAQPFVGESSFGRWRRAMRAWLIDQLDRDLLTVELAVSLCRRAWKTEKVWEVHARSGYGDYGGNAPDLPPG